MLHEKYYKPFQGKKYIFLLEKVFLSVFSFYIHVLIENEGKCKKYINFLWQFIFFSQNCINYPLSSVSWRINIFSKKTIFILVKKKGIYAISRKKFLFTEKVNFSKIFCLLNCFHQKINKKH